jgi:hypothetical protein
MKLAGRTLLLTTLFLFSICAARAADTASITDKSDDGAYIGLDDGTKWIVSPSDRSTASTWTVGDDVVIVDDSKSCSGVEIIDTDENGDEVCAKRITE